MSQATELTNQIINHIYQNNGYAFRCSDVGIYDTKIQQFRTGAKKGISDVLFCYKGCFGACEIKIGKDYLSPEQIGFLKNVVHCGGYTFVAKDFLSFQEWFNQKVINKAS